MKIEFGLLGLVAAGKGGKGGKHGGISIGSDSGNDRWIWDTPLCLDKANECTEEVLTGTSGSIEFGPDKYQQKTNYIFKIQTGANRRIKMKFDKKFGFDLEWHNQCGFDKVHIYSGNEDDNKRIARFCGPKAGQSYPFDATKNVRYWPKTGKMAMWDWAKAVAIGEAFVAVDIDQSFNHNGFKLDWTTEVINMPNFASFNDAKDWVEDSVALWIIQNVTNKKTNVQRSWTNYMDSMSTRLEKGTKCQKLVTERVSRESQAAMKNLFEGQNGKLSLDDCKDMIFALVDIVNEYLAGCPVGKKISWKNKSDSFITKLTKNSQ